MTAAAVVSLLFAKSRDAYGDYSQMKMLVLGAGFGLCILPILWWNMQNGWVHAMALHSRSGVKTAPSWSRTR